jgi:hypothetical protein
VSGRYLVGFINDLFVTTVDDETSVTDEVEVVFENPD